MSNERHTSVPAVPNIVMSPATVTVMLPAAPSWTLLSAVMREPAAITRSLETAITMALAPLLGVATLSSSASMTAPLSITRSSPGEPFTSSVMPDADPSMYPVAVTWSGKLNSHGPGPGDTAVETVHSVVLSVAHAGQSPGAAPAGGTATPSVTVPVTTRTSIVTTTSASRPRAFRPGCCILGRD